MEKETVRTFAWMRIAAIGAGIEHLTLRARTATGVLIAKDRDDPAKGPALPYRVDYEIAWDDRWRVHSVRVAAIMNGTEKRVGLRSDGNGHWHDEEDRLLDHLSGAIDIDIAATPFTNTFPIRRLGLRPQEIAALDVIYIDTPSLALSKVRQRYTLLEHAREGWQRYLYEGLTSGFRGEVLTDAEGFVLDYPGIFKRL